MGDAEAIITGGLIDVAENIFSSRHTLSDGTTTINMTGGQILCGKIENTQGFYHGYQAGAVFNMTGGIIETSAMVLGGDITGRGEMHLDGGLVTCNWLAIDPCAANPYEPEEISLLEHWIKDTPSVLDIYGGTLKIAGDRREDSQVEDVLMDGVNDLIAAGYITAGGTDKLKVVYDGVFTVVTADCPEGDLNDDCYVDFKDIAILAANWLK
jgi:hypothetical protein